MPREGAPDNKSDCPPLSGQRVPISGPLMSRRVWPGTFYPLTEMTQWLHLTCGFLPLRRPLLHADFIRFDFLGGAQV